VTSQTDTTQKNHRRAVRFFWALLIGATLVSLIGNITHAVLPYIPHIGIQIGAAACLPSLSWPPCTASPSPSVRDRPAGFTAVRSVLLPPSV
jgi:hypothetical protein